MEQINEPQNVKNEVIEHQTHGYNDNASKWRVKLASKVSKIMSKMANWQSSKMIGIKPSSKKKEHDGDIPKPLSLREKIEIGILRES